MYWALDAAQWKSTHLITSCVQVSAMEGREEQLARVVSRCSVRPLGSKEEQGRVSETEGSGCLCSALEKVYQHPGTSWGGKTWSFLVDAQGRGETALRLRAALLWV